ncbi:PIN domain-containing protein [Spartinivicinus poritis]|uniref:PIN domain-containing protein n=1 Tax=Spartinivicinus poritis TaxID=2994640 RepID=A0ABT5UDH6_9GAMM|nr:PIN domain-containing protein [Spartinivicinus sp. A2-2]MDE1464372.1 PIN domain-containing protein [Spartinivicinus sp. A2-2]
MKKYTFDTNCFIDAVNSNSHSYQPLQQILEAARNGIIQIVVSLHTLYELEQKKDEAWNLAKTFFVLDHWPIGSWDDQVGNWVQQVGSWNDAKKNDEIQKELEKLAKSGNDIRDRGAYLDALCNKCDGFITSDKQLVGSGPAKRINEHFSMPVMTPESLVQKMSL